MAEIAGGTPLPLLADYAELLQSAEIWIVERDDAPDFDAALILQHNLGVTLIWSIAVNPDTQSRGLGRRLLGFAEERARAAGSTGMALYTNVKFTRNRDIYRQFGYVDVREERIGEDEPPWIILHMEKSLRPA